MKKFILFAALCAVSLFQAQATEAIKLRGSIPANPLQPINRITVIDLRESPEIGVLPFGIKREPKSVVFAAPLQEEFNKWFAAQNKTAKGDEMLLVLKKLNVSEVALEKPAGEAKIKAYTFLKKDDGYHFLAKQDTVFTSKIPDFERTVMKFIPGAFNYLVRKSLTAKPWPVPFSAEDLPYFEDKVKTTLPLFSSKVLKDGIYTDYLSFLNQTPEAGNYMLERNDKGIVVRAVDNTAPKKTKISAYRMYAYVENGVAYRSIFSGFTEILRNENGFYVVSNPGFLFPPETGSTYGMFGLIGAVAEIAASEIKKNQEQKKDKYEIYLDPYNGHFIL